MPGSSPTKRSLDRCRELGWPAAVVERWNPHAGIRVDLFGVIDLIVLDERPGVLGVQACAGASHAARSTKIRQTISGELPRTESKSKALKNWLAKGNRLQVWSWAQKGPRGKRKMWTLRIEEI